jgi:uncharacterized protein
MSGRRGLALLLVIMVIASLAAASALARPSRAQPVSSWSRSAWILLPAVEGTSGVVTNATVTLSYPGTGKVTVTDNSGPAQPSTLYSIETAFMVAMTYAGLDWRYYNLNVQINVSGQISGPSGSFGVLLAVYSLATGLNSTYLHDYAITGAASPSGLSGPIGGLSYKCEAAQEDGLGIVYPVGNLGGIVLCNDSEQVPVAGIVSALAKVLKAYRFNVSLSVQPLPPFNSAMEEVADGFINSSRAVIGSLGLQGLPAPVSGEVESFVNNSQQDLELAQRYLTSTPYAAASYAFTAYIDALAANYTVWAYRVYASGGSLQGFFSGQANEVASEATSALSRLTNYSNASYGLAYEELLATAFARLADSLYYAGYASSASQGINISLAYVPAYYLGVAKARIESAVGWVAAANATRGLGPLLSPGLVSSTAEALGSFTDTAINYADSLINYYVQQFESIGDIAEAQALQSMEGDLNFLVKEGDQLLSQGYYVASIGVYEDALTNALNIIFIESGNFSNPAVVGPYVRELEAEYSLLGSALSMRGLGSSLDSSYMSYAETLLPTDPQDAIYIMETAVIDELAWYLGAISYGGAPATQQQGAGQSPVLTAALVLAAMALGATAVAAASLWSYKKYVASVSRP